MLQTSERLLRMLSLFQGRRYWSGRDLAERLEITSRTVRRDVDKLRTLGYPIHATSGVEGGYQLGAGSTLPPLLLDDEEAVAVALGLRCAATGAIQGVEEVSVRALAKIEQLLPARLARRVALMQTMIVTAPAAPAAVDGRTLSAIAGACRDQETLRFRYCDYAGATTARVVEPHRLVHTGRRWYLVAWDANREDWRTFRVDRIQPRISTGTRFEARQPPARDLAAYVTRGVSFSAVQPARIRMLASAEVVTKRVPPGIGKVEPCDDATCILEVGAGSYESLAMHLVLLGIDFEVREPEELVREIRRIAERYLRAIS